MGMAASQARYLGLTARKTNVEYEGQQINQARTALGNQSATLWNQMLSLSIPTCPNTTDYTTVQYSFSDGYNKYTISNVQSVEKEIDGVKYNKQITYYYNQDTFKGIQSKNTNPQAQKIDDWSATVNTDNIEVIDDGAGGVKYALAGDNTIEVTRNTVDTKSAEYTAYLKANKLDKLDDGEELYSFKYTDADGKEQTVYQRGNDIVNLDAGNVGKKMSSATLANNPSYMVGNSKATLYDPNDKEQLAAYEQLKQDFPEQDFDADQVYVYKKTGNQMFFAKKSDLDACIASGQVDVKDDRFQISSQIDYQAPLNQYYATTISQKVENTDYAIMDDFSGSGRFSNVKLSTMSDTFEVQSEEITDENAYNDAMNQYNYDVTKYEKSMADINAKTSVIQEQDRQLELRLKQLETEQKALTTEMDAVKGIISKNVESTFKTFSS